MGERRRAPADGGGARRAPERYESAILWVLADNPRARRFYEREGWRLDGGEKTDTFPGVPVTEVRYRVALARCRGSKPNVSR